jgi:hypothetical protein
LVEHAIAEDFYNYAITQIIAVYTAMYPSKYLYLLLTRKVDKLGTVVDSGNEHTDKYPN